MNLTKQLIWIISEMTPRQAAVVLLLCGRTPLEIKKAVPELGSVSISRLREALYIPKFKRGRPLGSFTDTERIAKILEAVRRLPQNKVAKIFGVTRQCVNQIVHRDRTRARRLLHDSVKSGAVTRPTKCQRCRGSGVIEAHHPDYSKPLAVKWLCRPCHLAA